MRPCDPLNIDAGLSELLGSVNRKALAKLVRLGKAAVPIVRQGLTHPDWKVRRDCLRFLDHHIDAESAQMVRVLLHDDHPEVRKWAAHALGCDLCKGGAELGFDPVPELVAVARADSSLRVRRSATVCLAWTQPPDPRIGSFLAKLLETTTDAKVRMHAKLGISRHGAGSDAA